MGACIGKKNSKYFKHKKNQPDTTKAPQIVIQDDTEEKKTSPTPLKELPMTNGAVGDHDDDDRLSKTDGDSVNSELQNFIDQQQIITKVLTQPFTSRIVSTTETELELELAKIVLENSRNDQAEDKPTVTTPTST